MLSYSAFCLSCLKMTLQSQSQAWGKQPWSTVTIVLIKFPISIWYQCHHKNQIQGQKSSWKLFPSYAAPSSAPVGSPGYKVMFFCRLITPRKNKIRRQKCIGHTKKYELERKTFVTFVRYQEYYVEHKTLNTGCPFHGLQTNYIVATRLQLLILNKSWLS